MSERDFVRLYLRDLIVPIFTNTDRKWLRKRSLGGKGGTQRYGLYQLVMNDLGPEGLTISEVRKILRSRYYGTSNLRDNLNGLEIDGLIVIKGEFILPRITTT